MLFLDDYYYTNTPNPKNTWFSVTSGLILRNTNRLKKKIKHLNFSAPQLISSFTIPPPPPSKLAYTKSALDLSQVESVDRSEDRMIEIRLKNKQTLSFKVPDTQCQIEWISLIRKRLLQIHHNLNDLEPSDHIIVSNPPPHVTQSLTSYSSPVSFTSKRITADTTLPSIASWSRTRKKVACSCSTHDPKTAVYTKREKHYLTCKRPTSTQVMNACSINSSDWKIVLLVITPRASRLGMIVRPIVCL